MSILNYVPTFKVIEMNRSTGLVMGHVLSQNLGGATLKSNTTAAPGHTFIENGIVVGLSNDRTIENFDPEKHAQPFIVFTEELNTYLDALKYYATEKIGTEVYPRAVALYNGDAWTTNNYSGSYVAQTYAKVVNGVLTLQASADAYTLFRVEDSSLPADGSQALRFIYIGNPLAGVGIIDTITFNMNGGVWDSTTANELVDVYDGVTFGASEITPDPTYADHQFDGWSYSALGTTIVSPALVIHSDTTVYAKWLELFDLTFNLNGGNIGGDTTAVSVTNIPEGELILDSAPTTPVYADHDFNGWAYTNTGSSPVMAGDEVVANDIIYAAWLGLFDITFDGNGGTIDGDTTAVVLDVPEGTLIGTIDFGSTPVFAGYNWISPYWWTTSGGSTDAASTYVTADQTIYTAWEAIVYDLTYVLEAGAIHANPSTYTIQTATITLTDASLADYTFGGWFTDQAYTPANVVTEIVLGSTGNVTLYGKLTHI